MNLAALHQELEDLRSSWAYAFAHAHGCSIGGNPEGKPIIERERDLVAQIKEHTA